MVLLNGESNENTRAKIALVLDADECVCSA
jgi:hypothetical protein